MINIKLALDKRRKKKDSTFPLVFRITHHGDSRDLKTGYAINETNWNDETEKIKSSSPRLKLIAQRLQELQALHMQRLIELERTSGNYMTIQEIKYALLGEQKKTANVFSFWEAEIALLRKANRTGNAHVYEEALVAINKIKSLKISFEMIDYNFLKIVEAEMLNRGIKINSVSLYFRTLRAVYNKAINGKVVSFAHYPFRQFKIKREKRSPRTIPLHIMQAYFCAAISRKSYLYDSWIMGKLMFMLIGINFKDMVLLTRESVKDGRIFYRRSKTKKLYSVKLLPEAQLILEHFRKEEATTLLGKVTEAELADRSNFTLIIRQKNKVFNAHLNKIGKMIGCKEKLTGYVFRYTWANLAKQLGYSKDLIAEALGHEYGNKVTSIYLEEYDLKLVDEMNQKITETVLLT